MPILIDYNLAYTLNKVFITLKNNKNQSYSEKEINISGKIG